MNRLIFPCEDRDVLSLEALSSWLKKQNGEVEIEFCEGKYYGQLNLTALTCDSLKLKGKGNVNLSGARKLKCRFKRYNEKMIVATLEKNLDFERLKVEGKQYILAQYPNFNAEELLNGRTRLSKAEKELSGAKNLSDVYLRSLHEHEWGGNSYKINGSDKKGFDLEWIGDNNRGSNFKKDCVVIENAFELLDSENEWYYNKLTGELFLFDETNDNIELTLEIFDKISLITIDNCKGINILIEDINFVDTERNMFKMPWMRYLRSDWAFNFGSTIQIKNSNNISILSCNFNNLGSNAIGIFDYAENITIDSCDFENSNTNGILILGNPDSTYCSSCWDNDNHKTELENSQKKGIASDNYPRDISIRNCYFYNLGIEDKQSAGVCISLSHKVTVDKSTFHHLPRAGVNICENAFGGHVISNCDLFDCVRETGDHGPFNSWGRDRFWSLKKFDTSGKYGKNKKQYALYDMLDKNEIRHNRIVGTRGFGIDLDDGSSNYLIEDNLCFNEGIKLREGFFRIVRNNIIINAPLDLHATFEQNDDEIYNNVILCNEPLRVIIVNKGFTTKIYDNYFVNANNSAKKEKLFAGQNNFFVSGEPANIQSQSFDYEKFKKITFEFGKSGKPSPDISKLKQIKKVEKLKNLFGEFSGLDEYNRSMAGAKSFDGIYVDKLSLFSKLKRFGVKNNDVIISVNGKVIAGTAVNWDDFKNRICIFEVIRQQKAITIGRK